MSDTISNNISLIAKFKPFIESGGGGIFTRKTRKRLVGIKGLAGRDRTKNDFWYDIRKRVKNALKDLELFIEVADREQVNQAISREALEPIITALLWGTAIHDPQLSTNRAEIADMLILWGFRYFQQKTSQNITLSHERTMKEAVDLSDYLLKTLKGAHYSKPSGEFGRI